MLYSAILAATTAVLASASPLKIRQSSDYDFSVTNFSYGCSPGGCAWSFNASAPSGGEDAPEFSTYCSGTDYATTYVSCDTISDSQSFGAYMVANSSSNELFLKYEYSDVDAGARYDYYGDAPVQYTAYCPTCPTAYTIPVTSATAVA